LLLLRCLNLGIGKRRRATDTLPEVQSFDSGSKHGPICFTSSFDKHRRHAESSFFLLGVNMSKGDRFCRTAQL
jgi:hypothetical protein